MHKHELVALGGVGLDVPLTSLAKPCSSVILSLAAFHATKMHVPSLLCYLCRFDLCKVVRKVDFVTLQ